MIPYVWRKECKNCKYKNMFPNCPDVNCIPIKIIIPGLLWKVDWCKNKTME